MNNLCFVTGGDRHFFNFLLEMVQSLKATKYREHPLYILDCGLSDENKAILLPHVTQIIDPGFDVEIGATPPPSTFKAYIARMFLDKHFTEHRYYFWMDADTWIYDENCIEQWTNNARDYGLGIARDIYHNFYEWHWFSCKNEFIADQYFDIELFKNGRNVNAGIFCIDKESGIFDEWRKIFIDTVHTKKYSTIMDQVSLNVLIAHKKFTHILEAEYNYVVSGHGAPLIHDDIFYTPQNFKKIGIMHLTSNIKLSNVCYNFPVLPSPRALNVQEWDAHRNYFWAIYKEIIDKNNPMPDNIDPYIKKSIRFYADDPF